MRDDQEKSFGRDPILHYALFGLLCLTCAVFSFAQDPPTVRVMSFNVRYGTAGDGEDHWNKRKEMLFSTIQAFDPDLLGTQELLAFQGDYLRKQLPAYEFFGAGRDDGKRMGEFTAVYFKKERFERLDGGHYWLSETPEEVGSKSWDAAITRMVTWVKLRDRKGGATFYYLNTHWDHKGEQARRASAKLMQNRIAALGKDATVIVTGDFNTNEDGESYKTLLGGEPKLLDSYRMAYPTRTANEASFHGFKGGRAGSRIDWILHTPQLTTTEAAIVHTNQDNRYPSDHYPVTAVLRFNEK